MFLLVQIMYPLAKDCLVIIADAAVSLQRKKGSWAFYIMSKKKDISCNGVFKQCPANVGEAEAKAVAQAIAFVLHNSYKNIRRIDVYSDNLEVVHNGQKGRGKLWPIMEPMFNTLLVKYDCNIRVHHLNTKTATGIWRHVHSLCDFRTKEHLHRNPKSYVD